LAVGTERQFQQLCEALDVFYLIKNEKYSNNTSRVRNRNTLNIILQEEISKKSSSEWISILNNNGVPVGKIRNMEEVFEMPAAQNMILEEILEDGTLTKRVKTIAFSINN
jgi:crotonobetainyl-CoA:carnitine CoA-transferase CaiB-like acyl-CoA transferase